MANSIVFLDSFVRADSTNIGANYTEPSGDAQILTNNLRMGAAGAPDVVRTTTSAHAAIRDVKVNLRQVESAAAQCDSGPLVRVVNGGAGTLKNFYSAEAWTPAAGILELYRWDSGVSGGVLLETGIAITLINNSDVSLEAVGTTPVLLRTFYNGVAKTLYRDSSANRIQTADQSGAFNWGIAAASDFSQFSVEAVEVLSGLTPPYLARRVSLQQRAA